MSVPHPITEDKFYFVEKNLSFGASSSCLLFQKFSDSLKYLLEEITGKRFQVCNYLDDYLFLEKLEKDCNRLVAKFQELCKLLNCPLSEEKTVYATQQLVFLGILLDAKHLVLGLPQDKVAKALKLVHSLISKRKTTIKGIQVITGRLNFLSKALVPGRAFTHRMYAKLTVNQDQNKHSKLKPYHHITLDSEFLDDCRMWEVFLNNSGFKALCRPFIDVEGSLNATKLQFYSDASVSMVNGGFGALFNGR